MLRSSSLLQGVAFLAFCLTAMDMFAQQAPEAAPAHVLPVTGRVTDGENKMEGCTIAVYIENDRVAEQVTERSGKFNLGLGLGKLYTIDFSKPGFLPKRIVVDTRAEIPEENLVFIPLQMDLSLLVADKYAGADTDVLDFPFAIVRYDKRAKAFVQDAQYTTDMQRANGAALLMAGRASK